MKNNNKSKSNFKCFIDQKLPDFISFYKIYLVDELATLKGHPLDVPYGYCSCIGYLINADRLGSLTIPGLQRQYQFPDCHFILPLICDFNPTLHLQTTVEVYGEIRLLNKFDENNTETSYSLISRILNYQSILEEEDVLSSNRNSEVDNQGRLENRINSIKNIYVPSIHVHSIRTISNAQEILKENLRLRLTRKVKRKLKLHAKVAPN